MRFFTRSPRFQRIADIAIDRFEVATEIVRFQAALRRSTNVNVRANHVALLARRNRAAEDLNALLCADCSYMSTPVQQCIKELDDADHGLHTLKLELLGQLPRLGS